MIDKATKANPGRPKELMPCSLCGVVMGSVEWRKHLTKCMNDHRELILEEILERYERREKQLTL
jgi:hypothetical protein